MTVRCLINVIISFRESAFCKLTLLSIFFQSAERLLCNGDQLPLARLLVTLVRKNERVFFLKPGNHMKSVCIRKLGTGAGLFPEKKGPSMHNCRRQKIQTFSRCQQFNTITRLRETPLSILQLSRSNYSTERYKYRMLSLFAISKDFC